jgi:hypothetical protein
MNMLFCLTEECFRERHQLSSKAESRDRVGAQLPTPISEPF